MKKKDLKIEELQTQLKNLEKQSKVEKEIIVQSL